MFSEKQWGNARCRDPAYDALHCTVAFGKAISLYLIDGDPSGRIIGELYNWTGKAYKIPRTLLKGSVDREELFKAGIYFLFGRDENDPEINLVYVGEAEEVFKRLAQHQDKDFWNEAVIFISKDDNLNKAHIKFLEFKAFEAMTKANRALIQNGNTPNRPAISEPEQAVMTEFFQNLSLLVSTLGFKVFEPLTQPKTKASPTFFIKGPRGADAKAQVTNEGIVVLEGSCAATNVVPSMQEWGINLRSRLMDTGVLVAANESLRFTKDYLFATPSTAAVVVMGRSANGLTEWKDKKGRTLKESEGFGI